MANNQIQLIISALDNTKGAFNSLNSSLKGLGAAFSEIKSHWLGITAAIGSAAGIIHTFRSIVHEGEQLHKISQQIGISVEHLSGLKYAAELSEASIEDLTVGVKFLSKALTGTNEEGKDTTQILKALKVTSNDPYDALLQIADAFSKMEDGAGKTAIAIQLFGRGGLSLIPLLKEGSEGIRQMHGELEKMGGVLSEKTAKNMDEFNDNITKLTTNITAHLLPAVSAAVDKLNNLFSSKGRQKIWDSLWEKPKLRPWVKDMLGMQKDMTEDEYSRLKGLRQESTFNPNQQKGKAPALPGDKKKEGLSDADKRLLKWHEGMMKEADEAKKALNEREKREYEYFQWKTKLYEDIDDLADKFVEKEKARREGQIQADLAQIDIAEKERIISKTDATKERIRLNKELLQVQEESLETIDKLNDPAGWYAQQNAITETRKRLLELNEALKEQVGTLNEGLAEGFRRYIDQLDTSFQQGVKLAQQTAQAMEQAFSDFFFDAFQGKLKSLGDYLKSFLTSVQRAMAQALGQQVSGSIISGISSLFGGGGSHLVASSSQVAAVNSNPFIMHSGGYIPRFHFGGLSSDDVPAILQQGEYVVSRRGVAALDAINQGRVSTVDSGKQEVHNYYYINAVDAKSFADMVERNPGAITKILHEDQRRGGSLWR